MLNENKNGQLDAKQKTIIFWYIVEMVYQWRRFITIITLLSLIISVIIAFLLPMEFKATTKVLPSLKNDLFGILGGSNIGNLTRDLAPLVGGKNIMSGGYNYLSILNSRRALEKIIEEFDLQGVYQIKDSSKENVLKELQNNLDYFFDEYGTIEISVYDRDPVRAASMANSLVGVVNDILVDLNTQDARNNRKFIEKRLEGSKKTLAHAEDSLKNFQEESGMILTPEQSSAISATAELYALKSSKEIAKAILEKNVTSSNDMLQQLKLELQEIEKMLAGIPMSGLRSFRLYRDVAINQKIVEYLVPLYEQAKIQEAKDTPSILVLDKSVPPEKKSRPQRLIIIISGIFIGLILTITIAVSVEAGVNITAEPNTFKYSCQKFSLYCKNKFSFTKKT
jgi:uncharacterized protein involved in exopolysaccharide biosynthesis